MCTHLYHNDAVEAPPRSSPHVHGLTALRLVRAHPSRLPRRRSRPRCAQRPPRLPNALRLRSRAQPAAAQGRRAHALTVRRGARRAATPEHRGESVPTRPRGHRPVSHRGVDGPAAHRRSPPELRAAVGSSERAPRPPRQAGARKVCAARSARATAGLGAVHRTRCWCRSAFRLISTSSYDTCSTQVCYSADARVV